MKYDAHHLNTSLRKCFVFWVYPLVPHPLNSVPEVYSMYMNIVFLSTEERMRLRVMLRKGEGKARVINRARIMYQLDQGIDDTKIATDTFVSTKTIGRIRARNDQLDIYAC